MKHCILVKFKSGYDWKKYLYDIKSIFDELIDKDISSIEFIENCIDKENRYDLLIRITMNKETLKKYNNSEAHKRWKEVYSVYIDKKAIFDYEE